VLTVAEPRPAKRKANEPIPGARGEIKHHPRGEVRHPSPDHPQHRADHADPKKLRDQADGRDPAIEQHDQENDQRGGNSFLLVLAERDQVGEVLREANRARSNYERCLDQRLPDVQERHQTPAASRTVGLAQKCVRAAGARHRRAELGPHQAVYQRE